MACFQTRSVCGSLSTYMHQFPAPCLMHVWVIDSVSGYKHLPLPPWSNTFVFFSPPFLEHVLIMVPCLRTHQSSTLCSMCLDYDSRLCARIHLQPCSNTFDSVACIFASFPVLSQNGYGNVGCSVLWKW